MLKSLDLAWVEVKSQSGWLLERCTKPLEEATYESFSYKRQTATQQMSANSPELVQADADANEIQTTHTTPFSPEVQAEQTDAQQTRITPELELPQNNHTQTGSQ